MPFSHVGIQEITVLVSFVNMWWRCDQAIEVGGLITSFRHVYPLRACLVPL